MLLPIQSTATIPFSQPWALPEGGSGTPREWGAVLSEAQLVPGVTGKTVGGVYSGRRPEGEVAGN